jgi:hypothetical protein
MSRCAFLAAALIVLLAAGKYHVRQHESSSCSRSISHLSAFSGCRIGLRGDVSPVCASWYGYGYANFGDANTASAAIRTPIATKS